MIDKKKLTIILGVAVACTIALIVAIVWAVTTLAGNNSDPTPTPTPSAATETATPSAEPEPTPAATETAGTEAPEGDAQLLPEELQTKAENAAGAAAVWSGYRNRASYESRYTNAGFSAELVDSYESVWASVYDDPAVAVIESTGMPMVETFASIVSSEVRDIRGEEGDRLFVVAVKIHYDAQWTDRDGRTHLGGVQSNSQGDAIWGATVSEKTGEVVEISDPPATSLTAPQVN